MTPAPDLPPAAAELLFDARLVPHRSLGRRGFLVLMGALAGIALVGGLIFSLVGAWPVVCLLGIAVAVVYLAFRINYRQARAYETLRLTHDDLVVERIDPRGQRRTWRFQSCWLQVLMDDPPRGESALTLRSHGYSLAIGQFLTPAERLDLARALRAALARLRAVARTACAPCAPEPV